MPHLHPAAVVALATLVLFPACGGDDDVAATTTTSQDADGGVRTDEPDSTDEPDTTEGGDSTDDGDGPDEGSDEVSQAEAEARLQGAIERTRAVDTLQIRLDLSFDGGSTLGSQAVSIEGAFATDGTMADVMTEVEGASESVRILVIDDRAFIGGDGDSIQGALPDGAMWAEVGTAELLASPSYSDPGDLTFLYLLRGAVEVEALGDGRYRFELDLAAAAAGAPAELREEVADLVSFSGDAEPEVTGEVALDDEGRITTFDVRGIQRPTDDERDQLDLGDDEGIVIELGVAIDAIDEPVDVEAPEEGVVDIADAPEVAALLELEPA